jgi:hypothetical protein
MNRNRKAETYHNRIIAIALSQSPYRDLPPTHHEVFATTCQPTMMFSHWAALHLIFAQVRLPQTSMKFSHSEPIIAVANHVSQSQTHPVSLSQRPYRKHIISIALS